MNLLTLIEPDVLRIGKRLKKVAGTHGGEYHSACPLCGAGTDRFHVWPNSDRPSWWCRACGRGGDDINYVRYRDGVGYTEACHFLGYEGASTRSIQGLTAEAPPEPCTAPNSTWQGKADAFVEWCRKQLWNNTPQADAQLAYLESRGLTKNTIFTAGIGYNPKTWYRAPGDWGIETDKEDVKVWLPEGLVFPWYFGDDLWRVNIRRPMEGTGKYINVIGSGNALYNADTLQPNKAAMLVEGVFDALSVQQEAGDLVGVVACGTTGARRSTWWMRVAICYPVLVSHDNDGEDKGEAGADYWLFLLNDRALRWRPYLKDAGAMLEAGMNIRDWVIAGLDEVFEPEGALK